MDFSYSYSKLNDYGVNYKCVQPSLFSWFILIQYFFLVKLVLPSLLTAMFSNRISKTTHQTQQIWMYQRYEIVIEYENRLPFGPPLTIFCYLVMSVRKIWFKFKHFAKTCKVCCACFCLRHRKENSEPKGGFSIAEAFCLKELLPQNWKLNILTEWLNERLELCREIVCLQYWLFGQANKISSYWSLVDIYLSILKNVQTKKQTFLRLSIEIAA